MKKIATVLALVSLLGVLAVSCQKETTGNPLPAVVTRTVDYCIGDNAPQQTVLHGDVQWQSFLAAIFDSVDRGYRVSLIHGGAAAKEAVTFSTTVKADAIAWVDSMYNAGYDVTLWYDDTTGQYNAVAQKSTAPGPITPDTLPEHTFYPFDEYLPGTWKKLQKTAVVIYAPNYLANFWWQVVGGGRYTGYYSFPTFNRALSMIYIYDWEDTASTQWWYDADTAYQYNYSDYMTIDADSIHLHQNVNIPLYHAYSMKYYITPGDSLQLYQQPGVPPYTAFPPGGGEPISAIEWCWDTLLIYDGYGCMGVYVRDNSK